MRNSLPSSFWWLWLCTFLNRVGGFVAPFLALYLSADRHFSASVIGMITASYGLGGMLSALAAGHLCDRYGTKRMLLAAYSGSAIAVSILAMVRTELLIGCVTFIFGFFVEGVRPIISTSVGNLVSGPQRAKAFSYNRWATNLGFSIASIVAGVLAPLGYSLLFAGNAAVNILCLVIIACTVENDRQGWNIPAGQAAKKVGRLGFFSAFQDTVLLGTLGSFFLLAVVIQQMNSTLPISMHNSGLSSQEYGIAIATNGILIAVCQVFVGNWSARRPPYSVLAAAAFLVAIGYASTSAASNVWLYIVSISVWTFGEMIATPVSMEVTARLAPYGSQGRYQGAWAFSWSTAGFIAPLAGGWTMRIFGSSALWIGCGVAGSIAAFSYLILSYRQKAVTSEKNTAEA